MRTYFDLAKTIIRRPWHIKQQQFPLHPTVDLMLDSHQPTNWQQLLLEWPHVALTDPSRLAYTRDEAHGTQDRQTLTSVGKYLARHWPNVPDHIRRNTAALHTPDVFTIVRTTKEMIAAQEMGPKSCMTSEYNSIQFKASHKAALLAHIADPTKPEPPWHLHPYACYDPKHGWSLAVRRNATEIVGRALLHTKGNRTIFVRTFTHHPENRDNFAVPDTTLHAWLEAQGFEKEDSWDFGTLLECPMLGSNRRAPYLDGGLQYVEQETGDTYSIQDCGYECRNTSGVMDTCQNDDEDYFDCEDCGDRTYQDEACTVGRGEYRHVCQYCFENYAVVRGQSSRRSYTEYYIPENDAYPVEDQSYQIDPDYLPDDVVQLENGDYAEADDTIIIDGEHYMTEDIRVVRTEDEDPDEGHNYGLKVYCWQETESGDWYHDSTEAIVDDEGNMWHPDNAPEDAPDEEPTTTPTPTLTPNPQPTTHHEHNHTPQSLVA